MIMRCSQDVAYNFNFAGPVLAAYGASNNVEKCWCGVAL